MEEHSVARLIGAPPGYVGHDREGQLVARLREQPYSVVLLDEAEKAHPRVFDVFLQVFDAGRLTDATGRTVDARHAVFVLTSNLGGAAAEAKVGFLAEDAVAKEAERALAAARGFFRPELLNRLDEQIVLRRLDLDDATSIVERQLADLAAAFERRHGAHLEIDAAAIRTVAERGYDPAFGARGLRRVIEELVQVPLSEIVLDGRAREARSWRLVLNSAGRIEATPSP